MTPFVREALLKLPCHDDHERLEKQLTACLEKTPTPNSRMCVEQTKPLGGAFRDNLNAARPLRNLSPSPPRRPTLFTNREFAESVIDKDLSDRETKK